jgi:hypothetical protein
MWTKEDNKQLRQLIKEHKTSFEIRKHFGIEKLEEHPNKKYLSNFNSFVINEIKFQPKNKAFDFYHEKSKYYKNDYNFYSIFKTDSGQKYFVDFIYVKETKNKFKDLNVFNLSFTTEEQRVFTNVDFYELSTNKNEQFELIKCLIYVINESLKMIRVLYSNPIILMGETKNPQKINFYRNIIKDSLPNVIEIEDISEFTNGLKAYYYIEKSI